MAPRFPPWSVLLLALASGCGGETFVSAPDGGLAGGAGGTGATGGQAGAGAGGATGGSGGAAGAAGGGGCPQVCPDLWCGPGTEQVPTADGCCFTCEPIPGYCEGGSCLSGLECPADQFYFEFAPGCCSCTPTACGTSGVGCAQRECAEGQHLELPPESCCPVCVGDGARCGPGEAPCDEVQCAPGYLPIPSSGSQCCLGCAVDPAYCLPQAEQYRAFLTAEIARVGGLSCSADTECVLADFSSRCATDCGTAVNTTHVDGLRDTAAAWAESHCFECPLPGGACPPVVLTARCYLGTCTVTTG